MRTPLKQVRGMGSAGTGTSSFIRERITSVALLILTPIFVVIVFALLGRSYEEAVTLFLIPMSGHDGARTATGKLRGKSRSMPHVGLWRSATLDFDLEAPAYLYVQRTAALLERERVPS